MENTYFYSYKGRNFTPGAKTEIAYNLHEKKFSLRQKVDGRNLVVGYADTVQLENVSFRYDKSKQAKTVKTGVKELHAFVVGSLVGFENVQHENKAYYNPYKVSTFVDANTMNELTYASKITCHNKQMTYSN